MSLRNGGVLRSGGDIKGDMERPIVHRYRNKMKKSEEVINVITFCHTSSAIHP